MWSASGNKPVWAKDWGYVLAVTWSDGVLAQQLLLPQAPRWKLGSCLKSCTSHHLNFSCSLCRKKNGLSKQVLCILLHSMLSYAPGNPIMGLSSDQRSLSVFPRGCMCCSLAEYQGAILTSASLAVLTNFCMWYGQKRLNTAALDEMG